ncbi:MAG: hypothetical protein QMD22_10640 [archaeon]|nr:hypothetical protein [archaeon]
MSGTIRINVGDAIEGERIVCEFQKIGKTTLISATHTHRGNRVTLTNAYCVITKPLRFI